MSEDVRVGLFWGKDANGFDPEGKTWPDDALVAIAFRGNNQVARVSVMTVATVDLWVKTGEASQNLSDELFQGISRILDSLKRKEVFTFVQGDARETKTMLSQMGFIERDAEVYSRAL